MEGEIGFTCRPCYIVYAALAASGKTAKTPSIVPSIKGSILHE
jgi:hypothetical protein